LWLTPVMAPRGGMPLASARRHCIRRSIFIITSILIHG
jgi:hypothetical protein